MKRLPAALLTVILLVGGLAAQEADDAEPAGQTTVRFGAVDVYIDSGETPLAAYQLELAAEVGEVKIVGIEGSDHPAFKKPPYYDPAAMNRDRVILAAFTTRKELPKGKTRVARIHVQIIGEVQPQYAVKLDLAATTEGKQMPAKVSLTPQGETK